MSTSDTPASVTSPDPVDIAPATVVPVSVKRRSVSNGRGRVSGTILLVAAAFVAVSGVAFAIGRLTAPATAATGSASLGQGGQSGQARGQGGLGQGGGTGGFVGPGGNRALLGLGAASIRGTVSALAADRLTLELANGTTVVIPLAPETTYHRQAAGASADVSVGSEVLVQLDLPGGSQARGGGTGQGGSGQGGALPSGPITLSGPARDVTVLQP